MNKPLHNLGCTCDACVECAAAFGQPITVADRILQRPARQKLMVEVQRQLEAVSTSVEQLAVSHAAAEARLVQFGEQLREAREKIIAKRDEYQRRLNPASSRSALESEILKVRISDLNAVIAALGEVGEC